MCGCGAMHALCGLFFVFNAIAKQPLAPQPFISQAAQMLRPCQTQRGGHFWRILVNLFATNTDLAGSEAMLGASTRGDVRVEEAVGAALMDKVR